MYYSGTLKICCITFFYFMLIKIALVYNLVVHIRPMYPCDRQKAWLLFP